MYRHLSARNNNKTNNSHLMEYTHQHYKTKIQGPDRRFEFDAIQD